MITSAQRSPTRASSTGNSSAPTPMAPINTLSSAPKTRASTALGATRCTRVAKFTSTSGLPKPISMNARNADTGEGQIAISTGGTAQPSTPTPKSWATDPRAARASATRPPQIAPTPITAFR